MTLLRLNAVAITLAALAVCAGAAAQAPVPSLAGEYDLVSSSTAPVNNWGYTKGRVSIRKLDDQLLLILLACEWKREPKAVCGDWQVAQLRDGGIWLQDMNTFAMRMYFDPARRQLTIISRGFDAKQSVRRDVFAATDAPLTDPALIRRMKREQSSADSKETLRVFGPFRNWAFQQNRIELQNQQ